MHNTVTFSLNRVKNDKSAEEFHAFLCTECRQAGPLVTLTDPDEIDNVAHRWGGVHATATGHTKIASVKVSYSPGEMVDLDAMTASLRRTKPAHRVP
jgi:hypothetical protein